MTRARHALPTLPLLLAACVAYDTAGPPVPSLAGTYATVIDVFGAPPTPIPYVMALRNFYPWCEFPRGRRDPQ